MGAGGGARDPRAPPPRGAAAARPHAPRSTRPRPAPPLPASCQTPGRGRLQSERSDEALLQLDRWRNPGRIPPALIWRRVEATRVGQKGDPLKPPATPITASQVLARCAAPPASLPAAPEGEAALLGPSRPVTAPESARFAAARAV